MSRVVKVGSNNKCSFLLYHNFSINSVVEDENGQVYFTFIDSVELQEAIEDYYEMVKDRRSIYVDLTLYNKYLLHVKELVKNYKRGKVNE